MESGIKRTQRDYTLAFKLSVVEQVEKGELTYKEAQCRYGIRGRSTVLVWLRKHGQQRWGAMACIPMHEPFIEILYIQTTHTRAANQGVGSSAQRCAGEGAAIKKAFGQVLAQKLVKGLSVCRACRHMGISRQAYYQGLSRQDEVRKCNERVIELVRSKRLRQPRLGARKLHHMLSDAFERAQLKVGRDALFDILRQSHMLISPKRAYHKTTDSHHRFRRHPNLLKAAKEQVQPHAAEQVWVADITYLPTHDGFVYLSLVTDAYSRKIVGHHVHENLRTEQVSQALKMALRHRQSRQRLIHHSDRGILYCSDDYQRIHRTHGLTCSMTDGYDCYQNALAERINGILKNELLLQRPADLAQARRMVDESVAIYNLERPHFSLQLKTLDEVHRASLVEVCQSVNPAITGVNL